MVTLLTPDELDKYLTVMTKHGVQNLQLEFEGIKLVVSGIYKDAQPLKPDSEEDALSLLDRD